jgi:hypothetical protein
MSEASAVMLWTLYDETISFGVALALSLILNNYDIRSNWLKFGIIALIMGLVNTILTYFPQSLRILSMAIAYFVLFKFFFAFNIKKTLWAYFFFFFTCEIGYLTFIVIDVFLFGASMMVIGPGPNSLLTWILFPFPYSLPMLVVAIFAYKRHWLLFNDNSHSSIPQTLIWSLIIQGILSTIIICDLLFATQTAANRTIYGIISAALLAATILTFFFIWRILLLSEREAAITAQEQLAGELAVQIDSIRMQRHDFLNHVQVMLGLMQDGQQEELSKYLEAIMQEVLNNDNAVCNVEVRLQAGQ